MINKTIKLLRDYHNLSQKDLAEKLQISKSYLSELESGKKQVPIRIIEKYSSLFGLAMSSIFLISENMEYKEVHLSTSKKVKVIIEWYNSNADASLNS